MDAAIAEADKLRITGPQKIEKLSLGGSCSKNCVFPFIFDRKVNERLEDMTILCSRNFDVVAQQPSVVVEAERPVGEQSVALETILDNVGRWLVEVKKIVSLLGMGGIGKITLLILM